MLSKHIIRALIPRRNIHKTVRNSVLSQSFSLENEWSGRHVALGKLGLGGDYEWISAVQKKFIGGGYASAVDVDAAVCVAEQKDQVDDVIELLYKLRHSVKAAEKLESSEYALVRLLLKYQPETILTLANDPRSPVLSHGWFNKKNWRTSCSTFSGYRTTFSDNVLGYTSVQSGRSFQPINRHSNWAAPKRRRMSMTMIFLNALGAVLFEKLQEAGSTVSTAHSSVKQLIAERLAPKEGEEQPEEQKTILEKIGTLEKSNQLLSDIILEHLTRIQKAEEEKLCSQQTVLFATWNERRQELAKSQAQKVLLRIRQDEIRTELKQLDEQEEQMSFFKNRLAWEKRAAENTQIDEESKQRHSKREAAN
ncbi:hypothetical protein CAEBREN_32307 [Caenorhabditis brenneri]|uniref:Uncharacterized protein n=1 Tax=Caenorhabditis brenneri TaxID=135651 RepID=G0NCG0_CAEBE|nr:hypothetical protein CAEBREN_32307 [Caenorhabditis brenneri]